MALHFRCFRWDLIKVFCLVHGLEDVGQRDLLTLRDTGVTRNHAFKLFKCQCHLYIKNIFILFCTANAWNSLATEAVNCTSVNTINQSFSYYEQTGDVVGG